MHRFLTLIVLLQLATSIQAGDLRCYEGFVGMLSIVKNYDLCAVGVDMENNEKQYFGWNGENHIFNESRPIDWNQGDCFVIYEFDTIFTYCYCRESLCNRPKDFKHILNSAVYQR
uniref:C-type lectin domain-containing protein n=1 Tax=Caenorhabditis tropicalis TaxID=1561998 RepID=A0A1I7TN62_9PELO